MSNQPFLPLDAMGRRILVMGPTNAGKSRLATAIARRLGVPAVHLDQLRHLPDTDWQMRDDAEFRTLHDAAIKQAGWVMEGNYSVLLPQRLARGTGVIVIDDHVFRRLWRYLRRTVTETDRAGALHGGRDSIKWRMLAWLWKSRRSGEALRQRAAGSGLPVVQCHSLGEVKALHAAWGLDGAR